MSDDDRHLDAELDSADHAVHVAADAADVASILAPQTPHWTIDTDRAMSAQGDHKGFREANAKRAAVLDHLRRGAGLQEALKAGGMSYSTYKRNRERFRVWAANVDLARTQRRAETGRYDGTRQGFVQHYFGMEYSWHHLVWVQRRIELALGCILWSLWPPEHGKTTTFVNDASQTLAEDPHFRITIASEGVHISKKILKRIQHRMEPFGPTPAYVADFGPFAPQAGSGRQVGQPWTTEYFDVYKKNTHDEGDYSVAAIGWKTSIVSTRADQVHFDDLQSTKTLNETDRIEEWFRQDALTRSGEYGINTGANTRVGEDDIHSRIVNDEELISSGILDVLKFPAILTDPDTGEKRPLWPGKYSLEQLDRMRIKAGPEAWDRNYMQEPGASTKDRRTFTAVDVDACKDPAFSLHQHPSPESIVYVGLDPAIGGKNCVQAWEILEDGRMLLRKVREREGLVRNEQIMDELKAVVRWCTDAGAQVTDVVIEAKNFQAGLSRDERLEEMRREFGFQVQEHLTGLNKYDENIGVASMATSFVKKEIVLPDAPDDLTRDAVHELRKQLLAWKPYVKGTKLRQDQVMAMWFVWILWRNRRKGASTRRQLKGIRRQGLPFQMTPTGLILPVGTR